MYILTIYTVGSVWDGYLHRNIILITSIEQRKKPWPVSWINIVPGKDSLF